MGFQVGQHVICVDANFASAKIGWPVLYKLWRFPIREKIYTVRECDGQDAIRLVEIVNLPANGDEPSFYNWHFRPVKVSYELINEHAKQLSNENNK